MVKKGHLISTAVGLGLLALASTVEAAPVLQLDITNGKYDWTTKTTVATQDSFELIAVLTPESWMMKNLDSFLEDTYYLAMAVTPQVTTAADLGSFTINNQEIRITEDMSYGNPPIDLSGSTYDDGDLIAQPGIYNTYFAEFAFQFDRRQTAGVYDSMGDGATLDPTGTGAYYATFQVNTAGLDPNYAIHFDLYSTKFRDCSTSVCTDEDLKLVAPHRYDAESAPVPEPATILLLSAGLGITGFVRRRRTSRVG